jgi:hypothetical protein
MPDIQLGSVDVNFTDEYYNALAVRVCFTLRSGTKNEHFDLCDDCGLWVLEEAAGNFARELKGD